jgi:hypothetical protein
MGTRCTSIVVATLGLAPWFASANSGDDGWTKVTGPFFSVEMPGKPEKKEIQQEVQGVGMTKTTSYESQRPGGVQFTVGVTEFPRALIEKSIPGKMLEGSRDGVVANIGASLTSDSVVFLDSGMPKKKWPGRTFVATHPAGGVLRQSVFLVDTFLLQLVYVAPKAKDSAADFEKFVGSLKLSGPNQPTKQARK